MDTLKIAYKILYGLEHKGKTDYMGAVISPAKLGVPEDKWLEVIQSLLAEGYVYGVKIQKDILGNQMVDIKTARITIKGAEYLHENSTMRKFAKIATDVIEIAADAAGIVKL